MSSSEQSSVVLTSATEQWQRSLGERFVKISYNRFMQEFVAVPPDETTKPNYRSSFMGMPRRVERLEAGRLLECFHKCLQRHRLHPGYKFVAMRLEDTDEKEDGDEDGSVSTVGKTRRPTNGALFLDDEAPDDGGACWTRQAMTFKFVRDDGDPFEDEIFDDRRLRCRRQLISCVENIFSYQHRAFCFTVLISGNHARLLRWDRCGALFTEKFHFRQNPDKLGEFLWRFSQMSPARQGYDTTVARVEKDSLDYLLMERLASEPLQTGDYVREYFEKSLDERCPWWKIRVDPDEDKVRTVEGEDTAAQAGPSLSRSIARYFLVGKPLFEASGLASRGMRGYVAVDCQTNTFVFLKDTWRHILPGIRKEGDILKMLNAQDVVNIPTLVCHGDVSGQSTVTDEYWNVRHPDDDSINPTTKQLHYRLVVAEVGRPLHDFRTGKELVIILSDCIEAHRQAYEKCQIVHFDISAGNILIMESSRSDADAETSVAFSGFLTDWEISKVTPLDGPEEDRRRTHMGTWQFLSTMSLLDSGRGICLADELESFFNVLLYYSIKYLPHNVPYPRSFMHEYFDKRRFIDRKPICGIGKEYTMRSGTLTQGVHSIQFGHPPWQENYPLHNLIMTWLSWLHAYYYVLFDKPPNSQPVPRAHSTVPNAEQSSSARRRMAVRQSLIQAIIDESPDVAEWKVDEEQEKTKREFEVKILESYRQVAQNLDTHLPILALIEECERLDWPENDKQPNQAPWEGVQQSYGHRKHQVDEENLPSSNKRRKSIVDDTAVAATARRPLPFAPHSHPTSYSHPLSFDSKTQDSVGHASRATPASHAVAIPPLPIGTRTSSRLAARRHKVAAQSERRAERGVAKQRARGARPGNRGRR